MHLDLAAEEPQQTRQVVVTDHWILGLDGYQAGEPIEVRRAPPEVPPVSAVYGRTKKNLDGYICVGAHSCVMTSAPTTAPLPHIPLPGRRRATLRRGHRALVPSLLDAPRRTLRGEVLPRDAARAGGAS